MASLAPFLFFGFILKTAPLVSSGVSYTPMEVVRSTTPLLETTTSFTSLCGLLCFSRAKLPLDQQCTHWSHDRSSGLCRLFPSRASEAVASNVTDTVFVRTGLPAGYSLAPGSTKAFRAHNGTVILEAQQIITDCPADFPRAAPAFPETDAEFNHVKALVSPFSGYFWTGIFETDTNGEYGNHDRSRLVVLKPEWRKDSISYSCVRVDEIGLDTQSCGGNLPYVCQYEPL